MQNEVRNYRKLRNKRNKRGDEASMRVFAGLFRHPYSNSLKKRITFYIIIVSVVPVIILFCWLSFDTQSRLYSQNLEEQTKILNNFAVYLDRTYSAYETGSILLTRDSVINKGLVTDFTDELIDKSGFYIYTKAQLWNFSMSDMEFTIYYSNPTLFDLRYFRNIESLEHRVDISDNLSSKDIYWLPEFTHRTDGKKAVSFFTKFPMSNKYYSVLKIDIPLSGIISFFSDSFGEMYSELYYCDTVGNSVMLFDRIPNETGNNSHITIQQTLENGHILKMNIQASPDIDDVIASYSIIGIFFIAIVILISLMVYFVVGRLTGSLESFIIKLEQSDSLGSVEIHENDEISIIKRRFIDLLESNERLYSEKLAALHKSKLLEMDLARARLNPHLLYNSLSVIKWKALDNNDKQSFDLIEQMTKYYRAVLNKGLNIVPIKDELELIKDYISINELAKNTRFNLDVRIDNGLGEEKIFKLLLQPFVENAILHGLNGKDGEKNVIITIELDKYIHISVRDNGYGIETEKLNQLNSLAKKLSVDGKELYKPAEKNGGYGIYSVVERLYQQFGSDFSLTFTSELGNYTEAKMVIPRI